MPGGRVTADIAVSSIGNNREDEASAYRRRAIEATGGNLAQVEKIMDAFFKKQALANTRQNQEFKKQMDAFLKDAAQLILETEKQSDKRSERLKATLLSSFESLKLGSLSVSDPNKSFLDAFKNNLQNSFRSFGEYISNSISNTVQKMGNEISNYAKQFASYSSKWNASLQGTDKTFRGLENLVRENLAASPYVQQEAMLASLDKLIEKGINYNLEQRAFLNTVSDKIATTFDVANGTLLRLIRIQQADSTQARLGMEAYLTQFLNATFQDTSYLQEKIGREVSGRLLGVSSQLSREEAVELEYVIQKWLGSLSSVGVSNELVSTLAEGINALGTGNISYLSSNQALQNLLIMGANRVNVPYADVLTQGLKADTANVLMQGIISYLQDIATSDNQVIKSTYANLFGTSVADLNAVLNLTSSMSDISKNTLNYRNAVDELYSQLNQIPDRMHISELVDNLFSNMKSGIAQNLANNPAAYVTWLVNDLVEQATGGINIPFVSALGTGVDLNANVNQLVKLGLVGFGAIEQVSNILSSLGAQGGLNLASWGYQDVTSRGTGFGGIKTGAKVGSSQMTYIGSGDVSDMQASTLISAYSSANETKKYQGEDTSSTDSSELPSVIVKEISPNVADIKATMSSIYNKLDDFFNLVQNYYTNHPFGNV